MCSNYEVGVCCVNLCSEKNFGGHGGKLLNVVVTMRINLVLPFIQYLLPCSLERLRTEE